MGRIIQFNTGFCCNLSYNELCIDILLYGGLSDESWDERIHTWNTDEDSVYIQKYLDELINEYNFTPVTFTTHPLVPGGTRQLYDELYKNIQLEHSDAYYNYMLGCILYHQLLYTTNLVAKYIC